LRSKSPLQGVGGKKERNMKKNITIKQHDITDCGAACLASVSEFYGLKFPIARIRQYACTDKKGTNVLGMIEAAKKLGFEAKGVKGTLESLQEIPKPAIAHIIVREQLQHFVVIYKVTDKYITIMDPGDGKMHKKPIAEFQKEWTGVLVLLLPTENFERGNQKQSALKSFIDLIRPHKSVMGQALFGAVIYSILGLSTSVYIGKITDYVLVDQNLNLLNLMGVIMILIIIIRTFIGSMKSILALQTGQRIDATLILGYYKHLLTLPQQFFDTMRVGEIISRVNDAVKIRVFINNVALDLVVNILILIFTLCLMLVYSWKLAVITLLSAPLFLLIYFLFNRLNKKYQRKIMESGADLEAHLVESLNSVSTIKRFGIEEFANLKTETRFVGLMRQTYHSIYGSIMANNGIQLVSTGITIAVLWAGSVFVINQELTPGTLMLFYSLTGYVLSPIGSLISSNQTIQDALIAADRLFQIMDLEREEDNTQKIVLERDMVGDIRFENVAFRYGTRKQVFESLNLEIKQGVTTAIVGESGSGKTTLVSLLQHLYLIQSGSIYIGKYNLSQIGNESLRPLVGSVPQQIELFAGNIIDNIAVGDFEPNMKKIMDLSEQLGIREFIEKLPNVYNTPIGEHGASLSGGERQRIAIARALYKDPEILIFDEATSSLDSISEKFVKRTLDDLAKQGKTIIVIAHRLSTIKNADNIVVLESGNVVETGNHAQLLTNNNVYSKLWNEQFEII
jgi:ATP-binding cassette subfamily B protein